MINKLTQLLAAAGWPAPVLAIRNGQSYNRWNLPQWGTVYNRFVEVAEMNGSLLLIKHAIGGISSASFDSADSLFRFLLPYTDIVAA